MTCNFLLTEEKVLLLDEDVSKFDYFIASEDLDELINDKSLLKEFVGNLGKKSIIVRPLGEVEEGVYFIQGVELLKVGEKAW